MADRDPSPKIIPALNQRQKERGGYLTPEDKQDVARLIGVPPYRVQALVSFFPHFRETPPPEVQVNICRDMSCHLRGSDAIRDKLNRWAHDKGKRVEVCGVSCLGRCDRAPAAMINEHLFAGRAETELIEVAEAYLAGQSPPHDSDMEHARQRHQQKWNMDVYEGLSDYKAVQEYLADRDPNPYQLFGIAKEPEGIDGALTIAGLLGMGGAGGRAYLKWRDVFLAKGEDKFVVCNADESEPGTFKDRDIMLIAPHLMIEGMILAGLSVGASRGWVYIRHEYHEQVEAVEAEIARANTIGALGKHIFGSNKSFQLEVFVSPGGYICGEQTALIEAMEDKRAEPRNRPPELKTNGFRNQPTLLSNVETFAWVPAIMLHPPEKEDAPAGGKPGEWYAQQGRKEGPWVAGQGGRMKGMRLFSISGDVAQPGVYEVPTGIPLGELIDNYCGGMRDGKTLVAAALSGPSGGLLPAKIPVEHLKRSFVDAHVPDGVTELDVREIPLDIAVSRAIGLMIGAGIVIYGTGADVVAEALACSRFFRDESCGKCVPCRLGSTHITTIGDGLARNQFAGDQLPVLGKTVAQLSDVMQATSICGLGQVASNPVRSILKYFPELVGTESK